MSNDYGLDRYAFRFNLLWFAVLGLSTPMIAIGIGVALQYGVDFGGGLEASIRQRLEVLGFGLALLIFLGLFHFRRRLFSVEAMANAKMTGDINLGQADPAVRRAANQLAARVFMVVSVADLPALLFIAIGIIESELLPLLFASIYALVAAVTLRPDFAGLLRALLERQGDSRQGDGQEDVG